MGYRGLMKKLHPDKAGQSESLAQAMEIVREAKDCCERALLRVEPPEPPRRLCSKLLCDVPGRRCVKLEWVPPECRESAPVRRFMVAALDPTYGRTITLTVLEPDYNAELRRFISAQELSSHTLAEEDMPKMRSLFRQ